MRGNDIGILKNEVFLDSGLTNLQKIFCPHCRIAEIEPMAFRSVSYVCTEKAVFENENEILYKLQFCQVSNIILVEHNQSLNL